MATAEFDVIHSTTTRDEIRAELDQLVPDALGMSGEEFLQRWNSGELDSFDPTVARLAVFARLLRV